MPFLNRRISQFSNQPIIRMTSQNNLEIKGNLSDHPLAELLTEVIEARLSGSLRFAHEDAAQKAVIYLRAGEVVFAVSNARRHRLFEILLHNGRLTKEHITSIPNFTNDQTLGEALTAGKLLAESEVSDFFTRQIEEIIKAVLGWQKGEWVFSPLVRIKDSINFRVETKKILAVYARNLSPDKIVRRFRSFQENFGAKPLSGEIDETPELLPQEAFLLSRFEKSFLKIQEVVTLGGLTEAQTMHTLYVLWLGGFLYRQNWGAAFSERKISLIQSARLSLKRDEEPIEEEQPPPAEIKTPETPHQPPTSIPQQIKKEVFRPTSALKGESLDRSSTPAETPKTSAPVTPPKVISDLETRRQLEVYLTRVEEADTLYEVLGITPQTPTKEIKGTYFMLAKRFHPDLYHKEAEAEIRRRVQAAFTELAHAYEILKDESSREIYDYKNREKIAASTSKFGTAKVKTKNAAPADSEENRAALAKESFEQGYTCLMDEDHEEALPLLARAVHLAPDNARYHAFYGKILTYDESSRRKAEGELQTAIKLDPNNSVYRLMLAEFYRDVGLHRRAEGELQRLLAMFPSNREAKEMLDSLPKK